jgi:hypothetical protein
MSNSIDDFWRLKLEKCEKALERNNFQVFRAGEVTEAREIVFAEILPMIRPKTVSWGDSLTLAATGVLDEIRQAGDIQLIETFGPHLSRDEKTKRRRQALLVDLFFTGTNAVTETGKLVNLDMVGNRVAAMIFGPRNVVLMVGRNKIVPEVEDAMRRIKGYAAPINAMRHDGFKTPCRKTGRCMECSSPDRICNAWSVIEKSFPKERIKVVLIDQDLGL